MIALREPPPVDPSICQVVLLARTAEWSRLATVLLWAGLGFGLFGVASTLTAVCDGLGCTPGELFSVAPAQSR